MLFVGVLGGCGGTQATEETANAAISQGGAAKSPAVPVTIKPSKRTPIVGSLPKLQVTSPKGGLQLAKDVRLDVSIDHWALAPAPGRHIALIIDNEPSIAIRDVSKPLNISKLARQELNKELTAGTHVVRMFPSRATHESVKRGTPLVVQVLYIDRPSSTFRFNAHAPLLTYSQPYGCYPSNTPVMLDFYVSNTQLGPAASKVRVSVDAKHIDDLKYWSPHFIYGLSDGDHAVRLQLIDKRGRPLPGPYNDTTRAIRVGNCN